MSSTNQLSLSFSLFSNFSQSHLFTLSVFPHSFPSICFLPSFLSKLTFSCSHLDLSSLFRKLSTPLKFPLPLSQLSHLLPLLALLTKAKKQHRYHARSIHIPPHIQVPVQPSEAATEHEALGRGGRQDLWNQMALQQSKRLLGVSSFQFLITAGPNQLTDHGDVLVMQDGAL